MRTPFSLTIHICFGVCDKTRCSINNSIVAGIYGLDDFQTFLAFLHGVWPTVE